MSDTQTISEEDISPRAKLCDWLEKFERGGLLAKQNNNKSKLHNFISDMSLSPFEFREGLGSLCKFLMEGAQLAKEASIDHSNTSSNERVSNSIILKESSSMYYPSSVKKTVLVKKAPLLHNLAGMTSEEYERLKNLPYSSFTRNCSCSIDGGVRNMEQWVVSLVQEYAEKKLRAENKLLTDPKTRVTPRNRIKSLSVDNQRICAGPCAFSQRTPPGLPKA